VPGWTWFLAIPRTILFTATIRMVGDPAEVILSAGRSERDHQVHWSDVDSKSPDPRK